MFSLKKYFEKIINDFFTPKPYSGKFSGTQNQTLGLIAHMNDTLKALVGLICFYE